MSDNALEAIAWVCLTTAVVAYLYFASKTRNWPFNK